MSSCRVFYFSRMNTKFDEKRLGLSLHIGPAYQKLFHVIRAIRTAGTHAIVVTVPVCGALSLRDSLPRWESFRERGLHGISLGLLGGRMLNRLYAALAFLYFIRTVRRTDIVILYNFFPEYILSALALRLLGNAPFLDVEDAPIPATHTITSYLSWFSFFLLRRICRPRCITVSQRIANDFGLHDALVVYGAAPPVVSHHSNLTLAVAEGRAQIHFVYGGSLLRETGIELFCNSMRAIATAPADLRARIKVTVTGFGSESKMEELRLEIGRDFDFEWRGEVSLDVYTAILRNADVGLCLKVPGTAMADTTFPSKVVEILRERLLLVTTPVSDIPLLFEGTTAVLLTESFADSLAESMLAIAGSPQQYVPIAEAGIGRADRLFSYNEVGRRVSSFLLAGKR